MKLTKSITNYPVITEGGEGIIYDLGNEVIKQFKPHVNIAQKEKKIKMLIAAQLPPCCVAPKDVVLDQKGNFIGYIMDKVSGDEIKKLANKKYVQTLGITTKDIIEMLVEIQSILKLLHDKGIYIGDLNDQGILIDKKLGVHFIDCDSWTIGEEKCDVAMDLFKDPLLITNNFDAGTDTYAYYVMAWKSLTRVHPFGGTMNPDMNIMERMKKGVHVINNPNITLPRTTKTWVNLSPELISLAEKIFSNKTRTDDNSLVDLKDNLVQCKKCGDWYYGKFTNCPICDKNAAIRTKPISQGVQSGIRLIPVLNEKDIKLVINEYVYLNNDGNVVSVNTGKQEQYEPGVKYFFAEGYVIREYDSYIEIEDGIEKYTFNKKFKSSIVIEGHKIFFINDRNALNQLYLTQGGFGQTSICKCSNNAFFEVIDNELFLFNYYVGKSVINISGKNYMLDYKDKIINYGIHHDKLTGYWLLILENGSGKFDTFMFDGNNLKYKTDEINYQCSLNNICFYGGTIFIPIDGKIRGFSYSKNVFKDFECAVVSENSKLIKNSSKFVIVNDENIYKFG